MRRFAWLCCIAGVLGLGASFALTYDKIHVLQDAAYRPACNLNPVLSCGSVMNTNQSSVLGVPNTLFGLTAFGMLLMFGLVLLSGAVVGKRLWWAAQAAATTGVLFVHYLMFESVFRIRAICPWCFLVWLLTIAVFVGVTAYHNGWVRRHAVEIVCIWYLLIVLTLVQQFWYYWQTLI